MLTRSPLVAKTVLFSLTLVSGCSLRSADVSQSLHLDLSRLANARALAAAGSGTSNYACLGVSVTGFDVADSPGLQCGHPGVVAGPLSTSTSAIDVMVPTGPARKVTVFGITNAALCLSFDAKSLQAAKSLGASSTFDFFDDASVSVSLDYNGAAAFPNCNPSAIPTTTPFNLNSSLIHNPAGVAVDSAQGYLYVANSLDGSISKFALSTGAHIGSIGKLSTVPTGGAAGCVGAATSTASPGWCTGATFVSDSADGMFNAPSSIAIDPNGQYLYVTDTLNNRVVKLDASTGAFMGWVGNISTSPTGGVAGCNGHTIGMATPGWCTGGTAASGYGDGMLSNPYGIALDASGNVYVADTGNSRISKYNSDGAFQGWIGRANSIPTGGAAGCSSMSGGTFTPGWCLGGASAPGIGDGMLNGPQGIFINSIGKLIVADSSNSRINQYNVTSGAFEGWIGKVASSPTGGASGCAGTAVGIFTPGWCTGGSANYGSDNGMMYSPEAVLVDSSGNLYVADYSNNRINKYSAAGAFIGWMGKINEPPTGGAVGCAGAATGSITPGWCMGGTAASGSGAGAFTYPSAIALDSAGHLFVTDHYGLQRLF